MLTQIASSSTPPKSPPRLPMLTRRHLADTTVPLPSHPSPLVLVLLQILRYIILFTLVSFCSSLSRRRPIFRPCQTRPHPVVGCCVLWLVVVGVICFHYSLLISTDIVCVRILCDFISYPVPVPITAQAFTAALIFLLPWLIVMFLLFCVSSFYSLSLSSEIDCVPILSSNSTV